MKKQILSRIYVYVTPVANRSTLINIANSSGTSIGGGYIDCPDKVVDCLSTLGCTELRLPDLSMEEEFMRVMSDVRPRDLESALALLN